MGSFFLRVLDGYPVLVLIYRPILIFSKRSVLLIKLQLLIRPRIFNTKEVLALAPKKWKCLMIYLKKKRFLLANFFEIYFELFVFNLPLN